MVEARDTLVYLFDKYKGDWESIFKAVKDREEPDLDAVASTAKAYSAKYAKVVTLVDADYPDKLKNAFRPPFVLPIIGDVEVLNKLNATPTKIVYVESADYADDGAKEVDGIVKLIADKGIPVAYLRGRTLQIIYGDKKMNIDCLSQLESSLLGARWCDKYLATLPTIEEAIKYHQAEALVMTMAGTSFEVFALPGNSGCRTNTLIKDGASLCDCVEDLIDKED